MDQSSFDRIARLLGSSGATTRRQGLAAAIGTAIGAAFGLPSLDAEAKNRGNGNGTDKSRDKRNRRPQPEGPCGNGSRKDNACTKDSQCCTGLCNTKAGKKNLDGKGRCRCVRRGKKCTTTNNCCRNLTCSGGICGGGDGPTPPPPIPTGQPCVQDVDTCADADASCTSYVSGTSGTPAGTYCLLARGTACTADTQCEPGTCDSGVCGSCSCIACSVSCASLTGCATCTFTPIQAAVTAATDGDTITIGPGTYSEDVAIDKNLYLKGCPGPTSADIVKVVNATYGSRSITITNAAFVEIIDLVVDGYNDSGSSQSGGGIESNGNLYLCHNTVVQNGWWGTNGGGVSMPVPSSQDQALFVWDQTLITNNHTDTYGGGVFIDSYGASDISHGAQITGNSAKKGGGVAWYYTDGLQTVRNSALIDGNTATESAGGLYVYSRGSASSGTFDLQISGKVKITNNTAPLGGGINAEYADPSVPNHISISGNVEISGNSATTTSDSYCGGGIRIEDAYLRISGDVKIANNSSTKDGGGIASNPSLNNPWPTGAFGIAIGDNVVIENNTAAFQGGGIASNSTPIRVAGNAILRGNSAAYGGALYNYGDYLLLKDNVQVTGNTADSYGGGLQLTETNIATDIQGSVVISGNTAKEGGGLYLYDSSDPSPVVFAAGTSVTGNTATAGAGSGGGIKSRNTNAATTVTGGSVVTGNTPDNCADVTC